MERDSALKNMAYNIPPPKKNVYTFFTKWYEKDSKAQMIAIFVTVKGSLNDPPSVTYRVKLRKG